MHKNSSLLCTAHAYTKTAKRTVAQVTRTRASVDQCKPHGLLPPTKRISQMWSTYKKQLIAEYVQKELWLRTAGQLKHLSSLHISTSYKLPNFMTTEGLMLKRNRTIPFQNWWHNVQPKKKKGRFVLFLPAPACRERARTFTTLLYQCAETNTKASNVTLLVEKPKMYKTTASSFSYCKSITKKKK